jgi:hypothetical protein
MKILNETAASSKTQPREAAVIISYYEKPGIQAIANTPICRRTLACIQPSRAIRNTSATQSAAGIDL